MEIGLLGDSETILSGLLPLLNKKHDDSFLKEKQKAIDKWINKLGQFRTSNKTVRDIAEKTDSSFTDIDKPDIKPQIIASAVSEELEDNAIISVDSGTSTFWAARYISIKNGMKFSVSGTLASMACGLPCHTCSLVPLSSMQYCSYMLRLHHKYNLCFLSILQYYLLCHLVLQFNSIGQNLGTAHDLLISYRQYLCYNQPNW